MKAREQFLSTESPGGTTLGSIFYASSEGQSCYCKLEQACRQKGKLFQLTIPVSVS